jgi:hypothetical protein
MPKKRTNPGQRTSDALAAAPAMPGGYYSGDQPNPKGRRPEHREGYLLHSTTG